MRTNAVKKGLVVGIILLLIGVGSATGVNVSHIENLKTGMRAGFQPSEVWIDDDWRGLANCTEVTVDGTTLHIGTDAFANIQDGIDAVAEDGIVHVRNGTYYENVVVDKRLDLIGNGTYGIQNTIIDGGRNGDVLNITGYAKKTEIISFTIIKSKEHRAAGIKIDVNDDLKIKGCNISDCYYGIHLDRSNNNSIIDNIISDNRYGIYIDTSKYNKIINGNIILKNGCGIYADISDHTVIEKNMIESNDVGIRVERGKGNRIENNSITLNLIGITIIDSWRLDVIRFNNINDNDWYGAIGIACLTIARCNWWGDFFGPSGFRPIFGRISKGDRLFWFGGRIFYFPWLCRHLEK